MRCPYDMSEARNGALGYHPCVSHLLRCSRAQVEKLLVECRKGFGYMDGQYGGPQDDRVEIP